MEQSLMNQINKLVVELTAEIGDKLWLKRKRLDEATEGYIICMIFLRLLVGLAALFGKKNVAFFIRAMIGTLLDFFEMKGDDLQKDYTEMLNQIKKEHNERKEQKSDPEC